MKGIILAGGKAKRLYPITKGLCKQLLPVYDKPMIYYPLSVLMLAGIKDILVISTPAAIPNFQALLGDGGDLGLRISYATQKEPRGLAEAFIIGEKFIGKDRVSLVLGDNIFFGPGFSGLLEKAKKQKVGAAIFGCYVKNPGEYGVIEFDRNHNVVSLQEKPRNPKSNWVVPGLYFYDNQVIDIAKGIRPSERGELEITDVNMAYLKKKKLNAIMLGRGYAWLDTGTYDSLIDASMFIKTIEERQGLKVGCIEEIAYRTGNISKAQLVQLAKRINTSYGDYLMSISKEA